MTTYSKQGLQGFPTGAQQAMFVYSTDVEERSEDARSNPNIERDKKNRQFATEALAEAVLALRAGGGSVVMKVGAEQYEITGDEFLPVNTVRLSVTLASGLLVTLNDGFLINKESGGETLAAYLTLVDPATQIKYECLNIYGLIDSKHMDIPSVPRVGMTDVKNALGMNTEGLPGVLVLQHKGPDELRNAMVRSLIATRVDSFVHEYIHYMDKRVVHDPDVFSYLTKKAGRSMQHYLDSPIEYNAFYQQGISAVERMLFQLESQGDKVGIERILHDIPTFVDVIDRISKGFSGRDELTKKAKRNKNIQRNFRTRLGMDYARLRLEFGLDMPKKVFLTRDQRTAAVVVPPPLIAPVVVPQPQPVQQPVATVTPVAPVSRPSIPVYAGPGLPRNGESKRVAIDLIYNIHRGAEDGMGGGSLAKNGREYTLTLDNGEVYKSNSVKQDATDPDMYRVSLTYPKNDIYGFKIRVETSKAVAA